MPVHVSEVFFIEDRSPNDSVLGEVATSHARLQPPPVLLEGVR